LQRFEQPFAFGTEHVYPNPVVASQAKQKVAQPSLVADMHEPEPPEMFSPITTGEES
jgi:hypothetical protein